MIDSQLRKTIDEDTIIRVGFISKKRNKNFKKQQF